MSGSTISSYVTQTVTLGSTTYPSPLSITNGGTIKTASSIAVYGAAGITNPTVINGGTIISDYFGVDLLGTGANVVNTGLITGYAAAGVALYGGGLVQNEYGTIKGYIGVLINHVVGTLINTGSISGAGVDSVGLADGGTVENLATAAVISGDIAVDIFGATASVVNEGTLSGRAIGVGLSLSAGAGYVQNTGAAALITGVGAVGIEGEAGTVLNSGSLIGTGSFAVELINGGYVNNQNLITGGDFGVLLGATGTVVNTGTILSTMSSSLGYYAIEINSGNGYITNSGAAALLSGAKGGIFINSTLGVVVNAGTIESTSGAGAGVLIYDSSPTGNGIVENNGTAALITGYDGVQITNDQGSVNNSGTIIGVSQDGVAITSAYGAVTNAGFITGMSNNGVYLGAGGSVSNTGTITGATTASANRHSGIDIVGAGYVGNTAAAALISGADGVLVNTGLGTVTNLGSISGVTGVGVYLLAGGTVTNTGAAAKISGADTGIKIFGTMGQVSNTGTITGGTAGGVGLLLSGGSGTVDNIGTAALITGHYGIAITSATGSVLNEGTVSGSNIGVELADGGTINNTGATALIYGAGTGVVFNTQAGTINNTGTISAQGVAAFFDGGAYINNQNVITGGEIGVAIGGGGTVMNTGSIFSTSYSSAAYYAIYITGPQATIINSGTAALISSAKGGVFVGSTLGVIVNDGTIVSTSGDGTAVTIYESVASSGSFTVQNNGPAGYIAGYDGIKVTNLSATVDNTGTIIGARAVGVDLEAGGTVSNTGTQAVIFGNGTGVEIGGASAVVTNAGVLSGGAYAVNLQGTTSNVLIADVGAEFIGGVAATAGSTNTLELAQGPAAGPGTLYGIGSQFTGFTTIDFDAGTSWTLGGNNAGLAAGEVINGFTFGDTIDLAPSIISLVARRLDSADLTESFSNNTLTLFSGGVEFATLNLNELTTTNSENFEVFSDGNGGTDIVMDMPCFCTGTKILTPTGEVNVEDLQVGDTVITVRNNGPVTGRVTWTGRRSLDIARHLNPDAMHPIRIIAGAFAPGLPERDLRVSPHHALYIGGALMEAISLVNGATVIQEFETRFVTYHHIALESHDVILAEGLPAETYLETGSRNMFEGESSMALHPNFQILGDADFCAPMIRDGAKLEAARAHLLTRAAFLGFTQTDEIDLTAQPRHGRA
jgi:hypothetical protein